MEREKADKPDLVLQNPPRMGVLKQPSFIWDGRYRPPRAAYPGSRPFCDRTMRGGPPPASPIWPCSERGLPCQPPSPAVAVGSYPTISPLPTRSPRAVSFLLHFPSGRPAWDFPSVPPCGVRTFLDGSKIHRDGLAFSLSVTSIRVCLGIRPSTHRAFLRCSLRRFGSRPCDGGTRSRRRLLRLLWERRSG